LHNNRRIERFVMSVVIDGSSSVTINSGAILGITSGTAVASTSGTSIDFTGIPSWVKRITVMFSGVSTNGSSNILVQIGSGSITTSGYTSEASQGTDVTSTAGFLQTSTIISSQVRTGVTTINLVGSNIYVAAGVIADTTANSSAARTAGTVTLSGTLDRVRITTVNGTDTFDAGSINILYE
jgi:hypothetical protein